MCWHGWMHAHVDHHGYGHCCCHGGRMRWTLSCKEELVRLEGYLKDLKEEMRAVEERIKEIKELKGRDNQGA
ncbi:hypothetical protein Adeg_1116 [Ammonifex degensii KC4]|uniref:DUF5320 domain-containing protein n=1 Tax=Ammonifex degensii (strain DSM 10501 / KC4) TaxID=429009 RepID=C9RDB1_AMMDK|nr:DUF5320 domain-containing protein [Ammonifex degensii]ACX52238.1 hypothetical protein Adeg_1116 [Ammonifex degensii KC4]